MQDPIYHAHADTKFTYSLASEKQNSNTGYLASPHQTQMPKKTQPRALSPMQIYPLLSPSQHNPIPV